MYRGQKRGRSLAETGREGLEEGLQRPEDGGLGLSGLLVSASRRKGPQGFVAELGHPHGGHELLELADVIRRELGVETSAIDKDLRELTIHYTVARYPNAANAVPYELYDEEKAKDLVERARSVVEWAKQHLR